MFEAIRSPEHVPALRFSGDLGADDIRQHRSQFEQTIENGANQLGAVIDIACLPDMNPGALESGAQADLASLQHIAQFRPMAFDPDKQLLAMRVGLLADVLPAIESRVFAAAQQPQAIE